MNLTEEIKSLATNMGVDRVGVAPVDRFCNAPLTFQPQYYMQDAKNVVVLIVRILEGICDVHGDYSQEGKTISPYAWYAYPIINWSFSWIILQVGKRLEDLGYRALPFPPTGLNYRHTELELPDFLHKHAAVAAGLGEFGLNRLLLTPQFGAHQRITSIITNAPLDADPMYNGPTLCNRKECRDTCIKICPMKAFKEELTTVKIGDKVYQYSQLDTSLCLWHGVSGRYLRGIDGLPRYPSHQEIDEIASAAGGMGKILEQRNPLDKRFWQFTHSPTCGACIAKCRAPWN